MFTNDDHRQVSLHSSGYELCRDDVMYCIRNSEKVVTITKFVRRYYLIRFNISSFIKSSLFWGVSNSK
jgi:hypothetical protein